MKIIAEADVQNPSATRVLKMTLNAAVPTFKPVNDRLLVSCLASLNWAEKILETVSK